MLKFLLPDTLTSNDNVLRILQTDATSIFRKPYAGYILLLFGVLDEEIATWFSRAVVSLDSLTGEDIACAVYGRKLRVMVDKKGSPRTGKYTFEYSKKEEGLLIPKIDHTSNAELLVENGQSRWTSDTEEITAITYGSDELAKTLEITDKLPCIVFMDGLANKNMKALSIKEVPKEVLALSKYPSEEIIKLLRLVVQKLRAHSGYKIYLEKIRRLKTTSDEYFEYSNHILPKISTELDNVQNEKETYIRKNIKALTNVESALTSGSQRYFKMHLSAFNDVDQDAILKLAAKIDEEYIILNSLSKSIETLKYYLAKVDDLLHKNNQEKLSKIFNVYIAPLTKENYEGRDLFDRPECERVFEILKNRQKATIDQYLKALPNVNSINTAADAKFNAKITVSRTKLQEKKNESDRLKSICVDLAESCVAVDHPSLVELAKEHLDRKSSKTGPLQSRQFEWDFFIAHAGADLSIAEELYFSLSRQSKVFLDSKCLLLGDDWDINLNTAQRSSRITVVLITNFTDQAYYLREEIASAIAMARSNKDDHRVVPVRIAEADVPYGLRLKHGISVSDEREITNVSKELLLLLQKLNDSVQAI